MMKNNALRVAMIIQAYPQISGGAERLLQSTIPFLRKEGAEVTIITRRFSSQLAFELVEDIPVYRLPIIGSTAVSSILFTITAQKLIGKLLPDILHGHEIFSPTTTALIGKLLFNIPIVTTLHGGGDLGDIPELRR